MKKLLLAAVALMATMSVNAQQMFLKPMVGGTLTTITGDHSDDNKMKVGLVAGAEFGYNVTEQIAVTAGLLYSMQGSAIKDVDDNLNMDYLNIPITFNYYVIPGLAIKAGVQPGILTRAKYGDYDYKDSFKSLDISIPLGASYEFDDFVIDARYNLGVSNINDKGSHTNKNSVIMLTLGYKIPF
jgi:hypothetical protein